MPAATSLIIAGASAAASAGQAIAANKRRKEADFAAKNAAAKLKGISETDYSAGLQVPTMGYDLAQQGVQQQVSTGIQALQDTGAAGVIGGLPTLTEQSNRANLELGGDLQNQEYQRDLFRGESRQDQDMRRVQRETGSAASELECAQLAASENRQIMNDAITSGIGALQAGYGQYLESKPLYKTNETLATVDAISRPSLAKPTATVKTPSPLEVAPTKILPAKKKPFNYPGLTVPQYSENIL